jgi:hypothetical protein
LVSTVTRNDLVTQLAAVERKLADRIVVIRVIVDNKGNEVCRIRRSVQPRRQPRDSRTEGTHD